MNLPNFKYIEKPEDILSFSENPVKCDCCGNDVNFFTNTMFTSHNINAICCDCVKTGLASKKFGGTFNNAFDIGNQEAFVELTTKTPPLPTYQEIDWPDCCNDFCKYLRVCTKEDLKNEKLLSDLQETFNDDEFSFEQLTEINHNYILLFQCTKCGKHYALIDLD